TSVPWASIPAPRSSTRARSRSLPSAPSARSHGLWTGKWSRAGSPPWAAPSTTAWWTGISRPASWPMSLRSCRNQPCCWTKTPESDTPGKTPEKVFLGVSQFKLRIRRTFEGQDIAPDTTTDWSHAMRMNLSKTHKKGYAAVLGLEGYASGSLPKELYELVKLRASILNGCSFCTDMHSHDAMEMGMPAAKLFAVAAYN